MLKTIPVVKGREPSRQLREVKLLLCETRGQHVPAAWAAVRVAVHHHPRWSNAFHALWCSKLGEVLPQIPESILQVDHSLDLHLLSSQFSFIWMLQDWALHIRKWMKSLIRALHGILETFVCTWGSMYAEIKQQPLLARFLCSSNLSSRLRFPTVNFSLICIYFFIFRKTTCIHGVLGTNHGRVHPATPWVLLPQQGVEGVWDCCLLSHFGPCCCGPGLFLELTDLLMGLWPSLHVCKVHGKSWWGPLLSSPGVQPFCSWGAHPRYLMVQLLSQAMLLLPSKQVLLIS